MQRSCTTNEIIEFAEQLAAERGWRKVFGNSVREHIKTVDGEYPRGSLSTYTNVVRAWRDEKKAVEATAGPAADATIVDEDRATAIDESLEYCATAMRTLRETHLRELDRAIGEERRKSDRLRAEERESHEKALADLQEQIDGLQEESDCLAVEAHRETARADEAENARDATHAVAEERAAKIVDLQKQLDAEIARAEHAETKAKDHAEAAKAAQSLAEDRGEAMRAAEKRAGTAEAKLDAAAKDSAEAMGKITDLEKTSADLHARLEAAEVRMADKVEAAKVDAARADTAEKRATDAEARLDGLLARIGPAAPETKSVEPKTPAPPAK